MELAAQLDPQSSQIFHAETCDHFRERQKAASVSDNMWLLNVSSKSKICPRPMRVMSPPPCSAARDMEKQLQLREAAWTVGFEITPGALGPNLCDCRLQLIVWELQTGIILATHPPSFQEHNCSLETSAVSSILLKSFGELDMVALSGKGRRLVPLESSWDEHRSKLH